MMGGTTRIIKKAFNLIGLDVTRRTGKSYPPARGSEGRPIANVKMFLEDIQARGLDIRGILDVGAHNGSWTKMALSVFPSASVIMIEPLAEMANCLSEIAVSNANVHYVPAGAGREEGELVQLVKEQLDGSTFLLPEVNEEQPRTGQSRSTRIVTIDGILRDFPTFDPDLVKLDVQGFELEALAGASGLFPRTECFIIETTLFHTHSRMPITREVIEFMAGRGFEVYDVTEYLRRPYDGALGQIDLAFAGADGFLRQSSRWE